MSHFFLLWNSAKSDPPKRTDQPKFLQSLNETFTALLTSSGWIIYIVAAVVMVCCVCYHFYDWRGRRELGRRRPEEQRATERTTQRRRPGAVYREHEIFRNAMKIARQYIGSRNDKNNKPFLLRRTRSGAIYGRYSEHDNIND